MNYTFRRYFNIVIPLIILLCLTNPEGKDGGGKKFSVKERLYLHIDSLSSDRMEGRYPTTRGDTLARHYIINYLKQISLPPFNTEKNYIQDFPYISGITTTGIAYFYQGQQIKNLNQNEDYIIYQESGNCDIVGETAFIGYGIKDDNINYDDFSKKYISDRLIFCLLYVPKDAKDQIRKNSFKIDWRKKIEEIESLNGLGIIFVVPDEKDDHTIFKIQKGHVDQKLKQYQIPVILMTNHAFKKLMNYAGFEIEKILIKLKSSNVSLASPIPNFKIGLKIESKIVYKNAYNILGFIKGVDTTRTIVLGAHYDHIGIKSSAADMDSIRNGADDNASGTALLLELANRCTKSGPFDCNLLFAFFSAEESGLLGSDFFLSNLDPHKDTIKALLNFDMVGRMERDFLFINHVSTAKDWERILKMIKEDKINLQFDKFQSSNDSYSFIRRGIPALWITTGFHLDIHSVKDELSKINFYGLESIYNFSYKLLKIISRKDVQISFSN